MKHLSLLLIPFILLLTSFDNYVPEKGSVELKKKKGNKKKAIKFDTKLPNVLIIGDSISMGYTKYIVQALKGNANVIHAPGNNQGTTAGMKNIDNWLKCKDVKWNVIHFNWGLHDLKHVSKSNPSKNSNSFDDPQQADLETYTKNLKALVIKLKATNAKLIFATTTPYPDKVKPARKPSDAAAYNTAATKIMKENNIEVNDLYTLILPNLKTMQRAVNVHFKPEGSKLMGLQAAKKISTALTK